METYAILIEWDQSTGRRAGNINPKNPGLRCNGWQNMDVTPAIELRIIESPQRPEDFEKTRGVTVLHGAEEINKAIDNHFPPKLSIDDEVIYKAHINQLAASIDFDHLPNNNKDRLKVLKEHYKIKGITETPPAKV